MAIGLRILFLLPLLLGYFPLLAGSEKIQLAEGETILTKAMRFEGVDGLQITGHPKGSTLRLADSFADEAAIVISKGRGIRLSGFAVIGNRKARPVSIGLPRAEDTFASHYTGNGILVVGSGQVTVEQVRLKEIAAFAILLSGCTDAKVEAVTVTDSGSRFVSTATVPVGRNNTTGGILIEDGAQRFTVRDSTFQRILGNGLWTHARYRTTRNAEGLFANNTFEEIGRDAMQVGHASHVIVEGNRVHRVGYPVDAVDIEHQGIPVAIDTAGNVDETHYRNNSFTEINGKCLDLDGFHHGSIVGNTCRNTQPIAEYPTGHFGIVMNNTNPDMQSVGITIRGNVFDGMRFGGLFLLGSGHVVTNNTFTRLGLAGCGDAKKLAGCVFLLEEPNMLRHGIYLGQRAERPAITRGNRIEGNRISGPAMPAACIGFAPKVKPAEQTIRGNRCETK